MLRTAIFLLFCQLGQASCLLKIKGYIKVANIHAALPDSVKRVFIKEIETLNKFGLQETRPLSAPFFANEGPVKDFIDSEIRLALVDNADTWKAAALDEESLRSVAVVQLKILFFHLLYENAKDASVKAYAANELLSVAKRSSDATITTNRNAKKIRSYLENDPFIYATRPLVQLIRDVFPGMEWPLAIDEKVDDLPVNFLAQTLPATMNILTELNAGLENIVARLETSDLEVAEAHLIRKVYLKALQYQTLDDLPFNLRSKFHDKNFREMRETFFQLIERLKNPRAPVAEHIYWILKLEQNPEDESIQQTVLATSSLLANLRALFPARKTPGIDPNLHVGTIARVDLDPELVAKIEQIQMLDYLLENFYYKAAVGFFTQHDILEYGDFSDPKTQLFIKYCKNRIEHYVNSQSDPETGSAPHPYEISLMLEVMRISYDYEKFRTYVYRLRERTLHNSQSAKGFDQELEAWIDVWNESDREEP